MLAQLVLDLPVRTARARSDFFVAPSNAAALAAIEDPGRWPQRRLVLFGPPGSGKSHLAAVWAAMTGAEVLAGTALARADLPGLTQTGCVVIEDLGAVAGDINAETALFHLCNLLAAAPDGRLLVTADMAPARMPLVLPDLASRLQAAATAELAPPDDALLAAVLVKLFADRQIRVPPSVIPFLVVRMERSLAAAQALVAALDARALAEGRAITRKMAASVLAGAYPATAEHPGTGTLDARDAGTKDTRAEPSADEPAASERTPARSAPFESQPAADQPREPGAAPLDRTRPAGA